MTDVGIIAQMASGVIFVVRLHRTHESAAKRAVRLLQVNNIPIIGCLPIGRDSLPDRYGYGQGDYYSNHYYHRYYESYKRSVGEKA